MKALSFTALGLTIFGLLSCKLLLLEMITAIQVAMLTLVLIKDWHPYSVAVAESVRYFNGYNELFINFPTLMTFTHPKTTLSISGVYYEA
jgi:hypothetical protein